MLPPVPPVPAPPSPALPPDVPAVPPLVLVPPLFPAPDEPPVSGSSGEYGPQLPCSSQLLVQLGTAMTAIAPAEAAIN
jgi:hypothetical protein